MHETSLPGKRNGIPLLDSVEESRATFMPNLWDCVVNREATQLHHLVRFGFPLLVAAHREVVLTYLSTTGWITQIKVKNTLPRWENVRSKSENRPV